MVRARNKGIAATESACLLDLIPNETQSNKMDNTVVVDGADGVGGEKLEVLKNMLTGLAIEVRNTGKGGGLLSDGIGAYYVQKEKVVPRGFGSDDVGISTTASLDADLKYPKGRCFIRPSGTEDVIRVYAEASTQEAADSLADSVAKIVDRFLGFGSSEQ
ncbi:Phosphoglucosamine mutase-related isoform 2 [Hibiscus syriacus]|uniref:Phosphoglucosamine mutase-related isoform 2 n=1 Tax=Hibiscus syriacus TaxID=106335 RepID=A0A6A3AQ64_HIBSY|nr:Phosphoglucosamine mutase-related isoform 2 [Hibiscus syriacus]